MGEPDYIQYCNDWTLESVKRLLFIVTSNWLTEIASKYLKKGSKVYIEDSLQTRKWKDQNGADREVTGIRADVLQLF